MTDPSGVREEFDVGGVRLPRPFKLLRLGHFGVNVEDAEVSRDFYTRLIGFRVSDPIDFGMRLPEAERGQHGGAVGYFTRHGGDHHSFVIFPRRVMRRLNPHYGKHPEVTINQITWQVSSLREVVEGFDWFKRRGNPVLRAGRDLPGSNWHFYPPDPDGHINELYYGIEQIGWDGYSKPRALHKQRYEKPPTLPHRSEYAEIRDATEKDHLDVTTGWRAEEPASETFDVGGVLLARPFKVVRIGPVRLFVRDMESALRFYRDELGFTVTEEVSYQGQRCVFLRVNTEHHSLALYPRALRATLGLNEGTSLMSFGLQLANYRQLRDALPFLQAAGVRIRYLPPELFPGIDYCAFAIDPDGHALQLHYCMEQVGWDGKPRPAHLRPKIDSARWPETVPAASDSYCGEIYLGPWS
jgi:catechol 2,3-dioxygenase-like lactoylglutathione lyase family enzyme